MGIREDRKKEFKTSYDAFKADPKKAEKVKDVDLNAAYAEIDFTIASDIIESIVPELKAMAGRGYILVSNLIKPKAEVKEIVRKSGLKALPGQEVKKREEEEKKEAKEAEAEAESQVVNKTYKQRITHKSGVGKRSLEIFNLRRPMAEEILKELGEEYSPNVEVLKKRLVYIDKLQESLK